MLTRAPFVRWTTALLAVLVLSAAACSDDAAPAVDLGPADAPVADWAGMPDQLAADVTPTPDGSGGGLPKSCSGSCAKQTLTVTFGSTTVPIERAVYGVDKDAQGKPGIYIEALHGGFTGCPQQSSPTTDRTLIISGLPLPLDTTAITKTDGLVVSLLDYKGDLLPSKPVTKATAASVTFVAADVCPGCVGKPAPSHPGGFVALDLSATFPEGTVSGRLYAVHCDSLDL